MIYDSLQNAQAYFSLFSGMHEAFKFLLNNNLKDLEQGRYEIADGIYANVQSLETKPLEDKKWEAHEKFIDIQYVITGREKMGFGLLTDFAKILVPYDSQNDIKFLDGEKFNFIDVSEGEFVIFTPNDVHAPMLACQSPQNIKKVIVKIRC